MPLCSDLPRNLVSVWIFFAKRLSSCLAYATMKDEILTYHTKQTNSLALWNLIWEKPFINSFDIFLNTMYFLLAIVLTAIVNLLYLYINVLKIQNVTVMISLKYTDIYTGNCQQKQKTKVVKKTT